MKSVERFYLVANSFFSTAEQVNKLNGKTYSSHPEMSADAQGLLGRGIERGWCIYSEHGYQRLQKGNPLQLRGRHVAVLLLDESEERKMKLKTTNYVLVSSGESANTENMAELSDSWFSSIPEMSAAVEALLGDFQENSWHIFPAEYYRELFNLNQIAEAGEHLIAFMSVISEE